MYGLILALLSFGMMGGGHGTYIPFALSAAPLAQMSFPGETIYLGLIAAPVLWACAAGLASGKRFHRAFLIVLMIHYGGVALSLIRPVDGDWSYFTRVMRSAGEAVLLWLVTYVLGQALLWYWFLKTKTSPARPLEPGLEPSVDKRGAE
jgi:hypothetical protein